MNDRSVCNSLYHHLCTYEIPHIEHSLLCAILFYLLLVQCCNMYCLVHDVMFLKINYWKFTR